MQPDIIAGGGGCMIDAKLYIGGHFIDADHRERVAAKYSGECAGSFPVADEELVSMAVAACTEAGQALETMPTHKRADMLEFISLGLKKEESKFAEMIAIEAGKPIKQARAEVRRAQQTFKFAASCASEIEGASIRLDAAVGSESKYGFYLRVPAGNVAAISPFNFPLNLVAHKVAPALAAGCPVILKPASYTPLTAFMLAELISRAELPAGAFNLVYGPGTCVGMSLVKSDDIRAITFTGSAEVGLEIARNAGIKRLILELGSNSAAIFDASANLVSAVPKLVAGGFSYAGQVCISVQRIFVAEEVYDDFMASFVPAVRALVSGDPLNEDTDIGPLISESDAVRVESWVDEAISAGAKALVGGKRHGSFYEPTVLVDTTNEMKVMNREVFGPVVCVVPFSNFPEAVDMANDSIYGLQAGVFSKNIDNINEAIARLRVGGVIINDVPTYRADHMPYGGVKMSGLGREGLKYAIEELTDIRMIVIQR